MLKKDVYSLESDFATLNRKKMLIKEDVYSFESDFAILIRTKMLKKKMYTHLKVILQH